jgi:sulfoxide reductase heme-binding subunit YedZ
MNTLLSGRWAKPFLFLLFLAPAVWLVYATFANQLGANPAEALVRATGDWTLRALCVVLVITPMRVMAGWSALARLRRMTGLFVYFYGVLHLLAYSWFDMGFEPADIAEDIVKRPFILVGFTAFVLLTAMALTSFNRVIRYMGAKRWKNLHKAVYAVAVLAVLHFFWMRAGKNNFTEVAVYGAWLAAMLLWRISDFMKKKAR